METYQLFNKIIQSLSVLGGSFWFERDQIKIEV